MHTIPLFPVKFGAILIGRSNWQGSKCTKKLPSAPFRGGISGG